MFQLRFLTAIAFFLALFEQLELIQAQNQFWQTAEWTWISGNTTVDINGVYGTMGVPSANNYPGGRRDHHIAIDSSRNKLYLFGGTGFAETGAEGQP
jgi:hypothetical protein